MDNYRAVLAVILCVTVFFSWNYFAEQMGWIPPVVQALPSAEKAAQSPAATSNGIEANAGAGAITDASKAMPTFVPAEGRDVKVDTPLFSAVFHSGGGILKEFSLKNYKAGLVGADLVQPINKNSNLVSPLGLLLNGAPTWSVGQWKSESSDLNLSNGQGGSIEFEGLVGDIRIIRKMTFAAESYSFKEEVSLIPTAVSGTARLGFTVAAAPLTSDGGKHDQDRIAYYSGLQEFTEDSSLSDLEKGISFAEGVYWGGVMSNYFLVAVAPEDTQVNLKARHENSVFRVAIEKSDIPLTPGIASSYSASYYIGPKDKAYLEQAPSFIEKSLDYGWFSIFSRPLVWSLKTLYSYVHNYGVAIILLTILIKILFWPLSHKSYKSMEQMKKLQPMIAKIREKYGDDREKINSETMQLYKTYKVNPAGGCLPIVIQIPVFFGLYRALLYSIELRHSSFLPTLPFTDMVWLADLSAKDPLMITPIVMGATMLLQQWITPTTGDPTQAKIMMIMPVVFTFIFIDFPSGLVLYWLVNNVISIAQQWFMLRKA